MAEKAPIIIKKKKISGGHGHHGGAWKVAYADFVTAMMCFFLVMWLMGSDEETKSAVQHYFNHANSPYKQGADPHSKSVHPLGEKQGDGESVLNGLDGQWPQDLIERPKPVKDVMRENLKVSHQIEELLTGNVFGVHASAEEVKFSLPEHILFKPGSARLSSEAGDYLNLIGSVLHRFPGYLKVIGHTDDLDTKGTRFEDNWMLSMARARAVRDFLIIKQKLNGDKILPIGYGSYFPLVKNETAENRSKNRRVEFILSYDAPTI